MRLVILLICLMFSSCATLINGHDQEITIVTDPEGAEICVNGVEAGVTPAKLRLIRAQDHVITLSKEGYHVHTKAMERSLSGVSIFYLLPGGLLSMAVDSTQGAAYCFDEKVEVVLTPLFHAPTVMASHLDVLKSTNY